MGKLCRQRCDLSCSSICPLKLVVHFPVHPGPKVYTDFLLLLLKEAMLNGRMPHLKARGHCPRRVRWAGDGQTTSGKHGKIGRMLQGFRTPSAKFQKSGFYDRQLEGKLESTSTHRNCQFCFKDQTPLRPRTFTYIYTTYNNYIFHYTVFLPDFISLPLLPILPTVSTVFSLQLAEKVVLMSATVKAEDFANYFGKVNGQTALKPAGQLSDGLVDHGKLRQRCCRCWSGPGQNSWKNVSR